MNTWDDLNSDPWAHWDLEPHHRAARHRTSDEQAAITERLRARVATTPDQMAIRLIHAGRTP